MSTRKNMTFPIVLTFIIIAIIVYLFANLEQSEVSCEKTKTFDGDVRLTEKLVAVTDGKEINSIKLTKVIVLPEKYLKDDHYLNGIKNALSNTLDYLGDKVKYTIYFNLSKDDKGDWSLNEVSDTDEEKILGIYAY